MSKHKDKPATFLTYWNLSKHKKLRKAQKHDWKVLGYGALAFTMVFVIASFMK